MAGVLLNTSGNLRKVLRGYDSRMKNMQPAMKAISEILIEVVSTSFKRENSPYGTPWQRHSATTSLLYAKGGLFGRVRAGGSEKLLVNTGALRNSFHARSTANRATVRSGGRSKAYAHVQQFGNPNNRLPNVSPAVFAARRNRSVNPNFPSRAPIPARPFMPLTREGKTVLSEETRREVTTTIRMFINDSEVTP